MRPFRFFPLSQWLFSIVASSVLHEEIFIHRVSHGSHYRGYLTFNEGTALLEEWLAQYPDYLRKESIGKSFEGRDLMTYVMTDKNSNYDKAQVIIDSLIHAREPAGLTVLLHYMHHVLDSGTKGNPDPEAFFTLERKEIFFVPFWNVDGYIANETYEPRMVRKNRRDACTNKRGEDQGVDLNRNWGVAWKKTPPCDEEYGGTEPFSEPETKAMKDLIQRDNMDVKLMYNIHTYGSMLTHPNNYQKESTLPEDDENIYTEIDKVFGYKLFGTAFKAVGYLAYGESDDWLYNKGHNKGPGKIISMSPEVGPEEAGFWPKRKFIKGICERNLPRTSYVVYKAGCEIVPSSIEGGRRFILRNSGLSDCPQVSLGVGNANLDEKSFYKINVNAIKRRDRLTVSPNKSVVKDTGASQVLCTKEVGISVCVCDTKKPGSGSWHQEDHALCNYLIKQEQEYPESSSKPEPPTLAPSIKEPTKKIIHTKEERIKTTHKSPKQKMTTKEATFPHVPKAEHDTTKTDDEALKRVFRLVPKSTVVLSMFIILMAVLIMCNICAICRRYSMISARELVPTEDDDELIPNGRSGDVELVGSPSEELVSPV